ELRDLVHGRFGRTPGPIDQGLARAVDLLGNGGGPEPELDFDALRESAKGLAASEEELLLLALFGTEAEPLLRSIRNRAGGDELLAGTLDLARAERIREGVQIVQDSGVEEITIEEEGMRVSVRRSPEVAPVVVSQQLAAEADEPPAPPADDLVRVESPMVGTFYRAAEPGAAPF